MPLCALAGSLSLSLSVSTRIFGTVTMLFLTCLEMIQVHCAVKCWNALYAVELNRQVQTGTSPACGTNTDIALTKTGCA